MKKIILFSLLAGFVLFLASGTKEVSAAAAESIKLVPQSRAITTGSSVTFEVIAYDATHNSWDVTDTAIITLPEAAGGKLVGATYTSENIGTWAVSATAGSFSTKGTLIVTNAEPSTFTLTASATQLKAGSSITFSTEFKDAQGNTWDATGVTTFATTEPLEMIVNGAYTPTHAGTWTVTATNGNFKDSEVITVIPSDPAFVNITPYPGPITLKIDGQKQVSATITDQYSNTLTGQKVIWKAESDVVTVSDTGLVTAKKSGRTNISASYQDITVSIPVEVETAPQPAPVQTNTNSGTGTVLGESETDTNTNVNQANQTEAPATTNEESKEEKAECEPIKLWVAIVIMAGYALLLGAYYFLIRKEDDKSWWIFPVLLTVIGVIIWAKYFCNQTFPWWPWALVLLGVIVTGGMRRKGMTKGPSINQKPPQNQPPMF